MVSTPPAQPSPDAAHWDRRYADRELVWSAEPNRFVRAATEDLPPGRALDVGAGEGRNAVWLAQRGWTVTAVDFSSVGLAKGEQLAARQGVAVTWVTADLRRWEPPAGAFDLVVIAYLQVDAALQAKVLAGAAAALAPGGTLVVVAHDRDNLERGHGGPSDPALLYTVAEATTPLADLTIDRAEQVSRDVELEGGETATAIDMLVVARRPQAG
jgi:SAM-dependent methyltransferase